MIKISKNALWNGVFLRYMFRKFKLNVHKVVLAVVLASSQLVPLEGYQSRGEAFEQSFDIVWKTVQESYWDSSFGGLDWVATRDLYRPKVAKAKDRRELSILLQSMLNELELSHFNIVNSSSQSLDKFPRGGYSGITLKYVDGKAYVVRIAPDSAAEEAGIAVGWRLKSIHRRSVKRLVAPFCRSDLPDKRKQFHIDMYLNEIIQGEANKELRSDWYPPQKRALKTYMVPRYDARELSGSVGLVPSQRIEYEESYDENAVLYIRFNYFVPSLMDAIRESILGARGRAKGIVIDLRSNVGGLAIMASGITGLLVDQKTTLGKLFLRNGYLSYQGYPQRERYWGPVAMLIDSGSVSTSEMLAAGLQESGRVRVFGQTSLGESLPSLFKRLPSGDLFQFAVGDYLTPKGFRIEKQGVSPDELITPTQEDLEAGMDVTLQRAKSWILNGVSDESA